MRPFTASCWLKTVLEDLEKAVAGLPFVQGPEAATDERLARWLDNAGVFLSLIPDARVEPGALDHVDDTRNMWITQLALALNARGVPVKCASAALQRRMLLAREAEPYSL